MEKKFNNPADKPIPPNAVDIEDVQHIPDPKEAEKIMNEKAEDFERKANDAIEKMGNDKKEK